MNVQFLIIDPQDSFCHPTKGELYVDGADKDMERLAVCIQSNIRNINDIHVTLDTHHELDVAHPLFWLNDKGEHPSPFTLISQKDVEQGVWNPFNPQMPSPPYGSLRDRMIHYTGQLEKNNRYVLNIWPPHCRIGTPGHNVSSIIMEQLRNWELSRYGMVDFVTKGSNLWTEHYSAVQADVPDPADPSTQLNTRLIQTLEQSDILVISGEASSHCVANSIRDISRDFGEDMMKKCILLTDCMSPVPGFEQLADDFFSDMIAKGMKTATTQTLSF